MPASAGSLTSQVPANPFAYIPPQCWTKTRDAAGAVHNPCYTCHVAAPRAQLRPRRGSAALLRLRRRRGGPQPLDQPVRRPPARHRRDQPTPRSWPMSATDNHHAPTAHLDAGATAGARCRPSGTSTATASGRVTAGRLVRLRRPRASTAIRPATAPAGAPIAYKPLPGAFWPTNGSADDVAIRLPAPFRERSRRHAGRRCLRPEPRHPGEPDHPGRRDHPGHRRGAARCRSRPRRQALGTATRVAFAFDPRNGIDDELGRPGPGRAGLPGALHLAALLFPEGTEFVHSVRYLDVAADGTVRRRSAAEGAALCPQDSAGAATPR